MLLENEPGMPPVLKLCVDWDGYSIHHGTLYPAYLEALGTRHRAKFRRWWGKLAKKTAIFPVTTPAVSDLKGDFPDWKLHEHILIGLAKEGQKEERAVVAVTHAHYTPTYRRPETIQRLTEAPWQITILETVEKANKFIHDALSVAFVPGDKPEQVPLPTSQRVLLLGRIKDHFNVEELINELCTPLGIPHEEVSVSGAEKQTVVRRVVEYCERRPPMLKLLLEECKKARSGVVWPQLLT